ncbi:MAG TPA: hypothetical protein DCW90_14005 [Lachnospiraceae bacterium]|nr:hypothetical protein [Lachnospiraceae bacterium]
MREELRNNKEMEIRIAENAAEIMLIYADFIEKKKIKSISDEDINSCEFINDVAKWSREFEYDNPDCDDWLYEIDKFAQEKLLEKYGPKKRETTYVRFHNEKEHVYITVPMVYEEDNEYLTVEQRCKAYDKLTEYVSDEFIHDTVISDCFRKGKVVVCYE